MRLTFALCLSGALALSACTTILPLMRWSKPGANYDEYLKDRYACILDARKQVSAGYFYEGSGAVGSNQVVSATIMRACMTSKGWVEDPNGYAPPAGAAVPMAP